MALRESDILNLPEAPAFISQPPTYSLPEFIALCEKLLPYWNQQRYSATLPLPPGEPFRFLESDEEEVSPQYGPKA
jgi:hypothetical protein